MNPSGRFSRLELDQGRISTQETSAQISSQRIGERDAMYWMRSADSERREGHFENALRNYSRALELDRTLVLGWVGQVQMLVRLEEYREAELWARKALELFRNYAGLLAGRAQALARTGDLKQAQSLSDASLAQQGEMAYCWMARGDIMLFRRDPVEQYCFEKAVQADGDWLTHIEIAAIYLYHSAPAKAVVHCRHAVEKAPDRAYCWYMQATVEVRCSLTRAARESFLRCLELVPNHVEARRGLDALSSTGGFLKRLFRRFEGG